MNSPCLFLQRLGVESLEIPKRPAMREIAVLVAERYGLTIQELTGQATERRVSIPRQEAMALIWAQGRFSTGQIGRFFSRDHTTVVHARQQYAKRLAAMREQRVA